MGTSETCDLLVVGAGIVGLTTAWELKQRRPSARITILEKEPRLGMHASGRNSGVLHSGIYYAADTMKAKVCAKGAARMREFATEHGIRCETWGKVIVACGPEELPSLEKLLNNARDNGIRFERLDEKGVRAIEPHARALAGIYSPDTAVIDSPAVVTTLANLLRARGVDVRLDQPVDRVDVSARTVVTRSGERFSYGFLFNCAGAYSDTIARQFGLCQDYTLVPFKGIYFKLRPGRDSLVKSSIYPVPDLFLPFLGVHLTRVISGDVYAGPTAIPAFGRENYTLLGGLRLDETVGILWELAWMYMKDQQNFRRLVHAEVLKYLKPRFLKAVQRLVPEVRLEDLIATHKVGIRPQLVNVKKKKLEMDYILERTSDSVHVLNSISPAFTSSFAFAETIVDAAREAVGA